MSSLSTKTSQKKDKKATINGSMNSDHLNLTCPITFGYKDGYDLVELHFDTMVIILVINNY